MNPYENLVNRIDEGVRGIIADGKLTGSEFMSFGMVVWREVENVMASTKEFNDEDKQQIMAVFKSLWNKYIVPLNIPLIPEPIESQWVEPTAEWLVSAWLSRQIDWYMQSGLVGSAI